MKYYITKQLKWLFLIQKAQPLYFTTFNFLSFFLILSLYSNYYSLKTMPSAHPIPTLVNEPRPPTLDFTGLELKSHHTQKQVISVSRMPPGPLLLSHPSISPTQFPGSSTPWNLGFVPWPHTFTVMWTDDSVWTCCPSRIEFLSSAFLLPSLNSASGHSTLGNTSSKEPPSHRGGSLAGINTAHIPIFTHEPHIS